MLNLNAVPLLSKGLWLAGLLALGQGSAASSKASPKKTVLTTFTILADMGRAVAGERLNVVSITKPGTEIHGYQPTPSDIVKAQKADLVMNNGLGLERWFERFTHQLNNVKQVTLSQGVQPIAIAADAYRGKPNPHAWMSPKNALIYVENIRRAFTDLDPAGAKAYAANAKKYSDQIRAVDQNLAQRLKTLAPQQRALVTCEGAFSYLARDYNLKEYYLWPVNAEEGQGTPRQVRAVIDAVRAHKVKTVFCESTVSPNGMQQVVRETGARLGGVLYVDSLSSAGGPVPTYLKLLQTDAAHIIQGLSK